MTRQSSSHNCGFAVFEPPRKRGNTQIAIVAKQTVIPARPAVVWHCLQRPYTITTSSSRPAERSIRGVWQVFRISKRIVEQVSDVGQQDIIALLVGVETLHHFDAKISCILRKTKCTRKNLLTISKQWRKVRFYKSLQIDQELVLFQCQKNETVSPISKKSIWNIVRQLYGSSNHAHFFTYVAPVVSWTITQISCPFIRNVFVMIIAAWRSMFLFCDTREKYKYLLKTFVLQLFVW